MQNSNIEIARLTLLDGLLFFISKFYRSNLKETLRGLSAPMWNVSTKKFAISSLIDGSNLDCTLSFTTLLIDTFTDENGGMFK